MKPSRPLLLLAASYTDALEWFALYPELADVTVATTPADVRGSVLGEFTSIVLTDAVLESPTYADALAYLRIRLESRMAVDRILARGIVTAPQPRVFGTLARVFGLS